MEYKYKQYLKYTILAVGFLASTAFYVKEDIFNRITEEKAEVQQEGRKDGGNQAVAVIDGENNEAPMRDAKQEESQEAETLSDEQRELVEAYVRELLGEYIEAESRRKAESMAAASTGSNANAGDGETNTNAAGIEVNTAAAGGKVNINTADEAELARLNGIGEKKAGDIVRYRKEHGVFMSLEELKNVSGIKASLFERIKNSITL